MGPTGIIVVKDNKVVSYYTVSGPDIVREALPKEGYSPGGFRTWLYRYNQTKKLEEEQNNGKHGLAAG